MSNVATAPLDKPKRPPKQAIARQGQRMRIDEGVAESIFRLVAKGMTETEACAKLDIDREVWYAAKHRHVDKFSGILTRLRAERINHLIETIDTHAQGDASRGIRADWRAADRLLSIVDPRFSKQQQEQAAAPSVTISISPALASLVYGSNSPAIDIEPIQPRQIAEQADKRNGEPIRS